jgi:hypothetical protein
MNRIPVFLDKKVDWIPVDVAATTISEILLSSKPEKEDGEDYSVHNIVNPRSIQWAELVSLLQTAKMEGGGEEMGEVSMREWVVRLAKLADEGVDTDQLPGLKLLQFFENMAESGGEGSKSFETEKSRGVSRALAECKPFCGEWVKRNLSVWRESGFFG